MDGDLTQLDAEFVSVAGMVLGVTAGELAQAAAEHGVVVTVTVSFMPPSDDD